jgi:serine/threonine protein kinase
LLHNIEISDNLKKILTENKYQLSWIPYEDFKIIAEIGKGGFAIVYAAEWIDKSLNCLRAVALKMLHESNNYHEEFIKEVIFINIFCTSIVIYHLY